MKIWAITNQKGGVGKTTTTITLAAILAKRGGRVLIIDLDPHGSLTSYLGLDSKNNESGIYNVLSNIDNKAAENISKTKMQGIFLYKSSIMLATLDTSIGSRSGKGLLLKNVLTSLTTKFDYVIIDCPPVLGILMINALAACDLVIIPSQVEFLSLNGLDHMIDTLNMIHISTNNKLDYLIVPTMYDRRTRISSKSHDLMKKKYSKNLWRSVIPVDTMLREASYLGLSVIDIAPKSRASIAYGELINDVLSRNNRNITLYEKRVTA